MSFNITTAAFEGLRVMKRSPVSVLVWGLAFLLGLGILIALFGAAIGGIMQAAQFGAGQTPTPAQIGSIAMLYLVAIPILMIPSAVVTAAVCRAVMTPKQRGLAYLGFGATELKILGAYLVLLLLGIVGFVGAMLVLMMINGGAMLASSGNPHVSGVAALLTILSMFGLYAAWIWLSVRFSMIAPATVATRKFSLGASWTATKGRFWTLLDLGVITTVRWIVVYIVMLIVMMTLMSGIGGMSGAAHASAMTSGPVVTGGAFAASGANWAAIGIMILTLSVFFALTFTIMTAPFAAFYRDVIVAKPAEEPAA